MVNTEKILCLECSLNLPKTNFHTLSDNPIQRAFLGKLPIYKASAYLYFVKGGIVQSLLHHLKYRNHPEIGVLLGEKAGEDLKGTFLADVDLIIPIPLHPKKQSKRGYNQSEQIALGLSKSSGIPVNTTCLKRNLHNETQTKKTRFERWLNTATIFKLTEVDLLHSKHVLVVDDVITTGATMEAALTTLHEVEGLKISLFTIAFA